MISEALFILFGMEKDYLSGPIATLCIRKHCFMQKTRGGGGSGKWNLSLGIKCKGNKHP